MNKKKIGLVLKEFREGKLKSSAGRKVTKKKQALAIALSEARQDKFNQATDELLSFARTQGAKDKKPRKRRGELGLAAGLGTAGAVGVGSYKATTPKIKSLTRTLDATKFWNQFLSLLSTQSKEIGDLHKSTKKQLSKYKNLRRAGLATAGLIGAGSVANYIRNKRKNKVNMNRVVYNLLEFARTRGSRDKQPRRRRKVRESHQELHNVAASNAKTFGATGAGLSLVDKQVRETALKAPSQLGGAIKGALSRAPRYAVKDAVTAAGIGVGLEGLRRARNKIRDLKK